jgi:hypothetical protein
MSSVPPLGQLLDEALQPSGQTGEAGVIRLPCDDVLLRWHGGSFDDPLPRWESRRRDRSTHREPLPKDVANCNHRGMPVELSDSPAHQSSGRRRTLAWVLGPVLALVLGGVVVRTVMMRDRPPLASRPLLIRTLDHPLIMLGGEPQSRFDPPQAGQRAGIPPPAVFQAWLRLTRHSIYDRAIPSSKPIPATLAWWSRPGRAPIGSPGQLVWLFQFTSVPCFEVGFVPPGQPAPPPDRDGCDEYHMFDAQSGAEVGEGFITRAGAAVLRPP